jgi:hypothetical protein
MLALVAQQINTLLALYMQNRAQNWLQKTTLLNLLITASIGSYTYTYGATELLISQQDLFNYMDQLIIPELNTNGQNIDELPIVKSTSMKFIYFFRNQIPDQ